jgi:hypothetical protein
LANGEGATARSAGRAAKQRKNMPKVPRTTGRRRCHVFLDWMKFIASCGWKSGEVFA